ncbi:MAG: hypothetical protein ACSHW0_00100 [Thalassotalea sp.]
MKNKPSILLLKPAGKLFTLVFIMLACVFSLLFAFKVLANNHDLLKRHCQKISFWQHINTDTFPIKHLTLPLSAYQGNMNLVSNFKQNTQGVCSTNLISVVLVKKLVDWHQQHSNGLDIDLSDLNLTFAQLSTLNLQLSIDSDKSSLPSQDFVLKQLLKLAVDKVRAKEITEQLVDGDFHLSLVFYGENHQAIELATIYASYALTPKPKPKLKSQLNVHQYQWQLQPSLFQYYLEQDYQAVPADYLAVQHTLIKGLLIMAESANTKVVRNYLKEEFPAQAPEWFNEIALEINQLILTEQ